MAERETGERREEEVSSSFPASSPTSARLLVFCRFARFARFPHSRDHPEGLLAV